MAHIIVNASEEDSRQNSIIFLFVPAHLNNPLLELLYALYYSKTLFNQLFDAKSYL